MNAAAAAAAGVMSSPERRMSVNSGVGGSPSANGGVVQNGVGVAVSPDRIQLAPLRANNASPTPPSTAPAGAYPPYPLSRSNSSYAPGSKKNPLSIGSIISDETS